MNYWDLTGGGNYLSHHGVEGQKWGDRNGPPYPLSRQGQKVLDKIKSAFYRGAFIFDNNF